MLSLESRNIQLDECRGDFMHFAILCHLSYAKHSEVPLRSN